MPGGFGISQPKRRGSKTGLKEIRQLNEVVKQPKQEPQRDLAIQAEVETFFAQQMQENPEELALAWEAGVYHPLADVDLTAVGARFMEPEEDDWLALARLIGWLDVEDEMDAIYFTAPPPDFALEQADWYVRPKPTSFLEEPMLLREVIKQYPITLKEIQEAIAERFLQLGWNSKQQEKFIFKLSDKSGSELFEDEWKCVLFELQDYLQDNG